MTRNRRRWPRTDVRWPARLQTANLVVAGTVRDRSDGGICFEPIVGRTASRYALGAALAAAVARGDEVEVVTATGCLALRCVYLVRWAGHSARHEVPAIGLELEAA
jgi:hypothetical protein